MRGVAAINVPPEVAPFMERHGKRASAAITKYLAPCSTLDERLGALGVLAQVLLACGDTLQAMQLSKTGGTPQ